MGLSSLVGPDFALWDYGDGVIYLSSVEYAAGLKDQDQDAEC